MKGMMKLLDKMLERVNGSGWRCVTPFFNARFEYKDGRPTINILTMNLLISTKFKKASGVL